MVGDVKQAIFAWREGDSRLMGEIIGKYSLPCESLDSSRRSCGPVLELVNRVCGFFQSVPEIDGEAARRWRSLWKAHSPAGAIAGKAGCAFVLESLMKRSDLDDLGLSTKDHRAKAVIAELRRVEPWSRGLSAAVLVRSNDEGAEMLEQLNESGIAAAWEGRRRIAEHPLVAALLALCRWLDHPGDTLALGHVRMSPLAALMEKGEEDFHRSGNCLLAESGFAGATGEWLDRLSTKGLIGTVDLACAEVLAMLDAAPKFDAMGGRGGLDFSGYISTFVVKGQSTEGCVQVMTMHASKGLGFDVVIVSLGDSSHGGGGESILMGDSLPDGSVEWILSNPGVLAELDPALRDAQARSDSDDKFEMLCLLYVALTRAKRELAVVIDRRPDNPKAIHLSTLVRLPIDAVECSANASALYAPEGFRLLAQPFGDVGWFKVAHPERAQEAASKPAKAPSATPVLRRRRKLPSGQESFTSQAHLLFRRPSVGSIGSIAFGDAVHSLFREFAWPGSEKEAISSWRKSHGGLPKSAADAVERQFLANLANPKVRALLSKKTADCVLWREQAFDTIIDGEWVTGVFDRVHVELDVSGRPAGATLIDFKTDGSLGLTLDVEAARRAYEPQIRLYVEVLVKLLDIPPSAVSPFLLFTSQAREENL